MTKLPRVLLFLECGDLCISDALEAHPAHAPNVLGAVCALCEDNLDCEVAAPAASHSGQAPASALHQEWEQLRPDQELVDSVWSAPGLSDPYPQGLSLGFSYSQGDLGEHASPKTEERGETWA